MVAQGGEQGVAFPRQSGDFLGDAGPGRSMAQASMEPAGDGAQRFDRTEGFPIQREIRGEDPRPSCDRQRAGELAPLLDDEGLHLAGRERSPDRLERRASALDELGGHSGVCFSGGSASPQRGHPSGASATSMRQRRRRAFLGPMDMTPHPVAS